MMHENGAPIDVSRIFFISLFTPLSVAKECLHRSSMWIYAVTAQCCWCDTCTLLSMLLSSVMNSSESPTGQSWYVVILLISLCSTSHYILTNYLCISHPFFILYRQHCKALWLNNPVVLMFCPFHQLCWFIHYIFYHSCDHIIIFSAVVVDTYSYQLSQYTNVYGLPDGWAWWPILWWGHIPVLEFFILIMRFLIPQMGGGINKEYSQFRDGGDTNIG